MPSRSNSSGAGRPPAKETTSGRSRRASSSRTGELATPASRSARAGAGRERTREDTGAPGGTAVRGTAPGCGWCAAVTRAGRASWSRSRTQRTTAAGATPVGRLGRGGRPGPAGRTTRSVTAMTMPTPRRLAGHRRRSARGRSAPYVVADGARRRWPVRRVARRPGRMALDMASAARAEAVAPQRTSRPLRAWQQAALEKYEEEAPKDFLVTATPGAGKTTFALTLAARLLERREVQRVVVVCPTDHLRLQWADAADRMGIVLDPGLTNAVGPVRAGTRGYVTTYAQVAGKPMLHAARATAAKSLVIMDEVHHAGDGLSWGEAVEEAFGMAARRLCLTGTPFRTKPDERIPFVRYEEDTFEGDAGEQGVGLVSRADFTYGYKEALADSVVRPVVFAAYTGTSRWRNSAGEVVAASLSEAGTRSVEMQAWRTALDPKGQWVPHVIAAMDDRITHLREEGGMPDAAGLILSDDPKASKKIERFATGSARIAVCVRMISVGVDVPRAAALAWMTSYRTPLF